MVTTLRFDTTEIRDRVASIFDKIDIGYEYGMHTCSLRIDTSELKRAEFGLLHDDLVVSHGSSDTGLYIKSL